MLGINNYVIVTVVNALLIESSKNPSNYFDQASTVSVAALNSIKRGTTGNYHARSDIQKQAYSIDLVPNIKTAYGITGTSFDTHSPYINGKRMDVSGLLVAKTEIILIKNDLNYKEAIMSASRHILLPSSTNSTIPRNLGTVLAPVERMPEIKYEVI